jgi:hypothetical protein
MDDKRIDDYIKQRCRQAIKDNEEKFNTATDPFDLCTYRILIEGYRDILKDDE